VRRFWFEFEPAADLPMGLAYGCGVTAYSYDEARELLLERLFAGRTMPEPSQIVEDADVSALDRDHVIPNMGDPAIRGIWFPLGYR
jgi:hypothetical protein